MNGQLGHVTEYYHHAVWAFIVGTNPRIYMDVEPLHPGEGVAAAIRLVTRLVKHYGRWIDGVVADAGNVAPMLIGPSPLAPAISRSLPGMKKGLPPGTVWRNLPGSLSATKLRWLRPPFAAASSLNPRPGGRALFRRLRFGLEKRIPWRAIAQEIAAAGSTKGQMENKARDPESEMTRRPPLRQQSASRLPRLTSTHSGWDQTGRPLCE